MIEKINVLRKEKKINLIDLSAKTGISRQWLSHIERGKCKVSYEDIVKIYDVFGFEIRAILKD